MGLLDKLKERAAERKEFKLQKAAAYKETRQKANKEYLRARQKAELEQIRAKAVRDARPASEKIRSGLKGFKKGLTVVRGELRKSQARARNSSLELPKKDLFAATKTGDDLLGFKKQEALPKKKLQIKRRVVYEYE